MQMQWRWRWDTAGKKQGWGGLDRETAGTHASSPNAAAELVPAAMWVPYSPAPYPLRLAGGPGRCAGRVELLHTGCWGTVCDDGWGLPDAAVVCRQLGCGAALVAPGGAFFGEGTGPIWMDNVRCWGNESALLQCPAAPLGITDCHHREDASVICAGTCPCIVHAAWCAPCSACNSAELCGVLPVCMQYMHFYREVQYAPGMHEILCSHG